ncbi:MAG: metal dependent phosphohydrolase [Clostridiales bacterium]|nr:metal dependent phosphohydrolase [Clostridiales bacterium]
MNEKLEKTLNFKRFVHSVNVMKTAVDLAHNYDIDADKAAVAGLLHDCARDVKGEKVFELCTRFGIKVDYITKSQPELLHGPIGAYLAKTEYQVEDPEIIGAIRCHTTGCEKMTILDKIIFIADYIEPNRNFPGIYEIRKEAYSDINRALVFALNRTIKFVMTKGALIHPDTINARNRLINEYGKLPMESIK